MISKKCKLWLMISCNIYFTTSKAQEKYAERLDHEKGGGSVNPADDLDSGSDFFLELPICFTDGRTNMIDLSQLDQEISIRIKMHISFVVDAILHLTMLCLVHILEKRISGAISQKPSNTTLNH